MVSCTSTIEFQSIPGCSWVFLGVPGCSWHSGCPPFCILYLSSIENQEKHRNGKGPVWFEHENPPSNLVRLDNLSQNTSCESKTNPTRSCSCVPVFLETMSSCRRILHKHQ